jgi:hypothetical protein
VFGAKVMHLDKAHDMTLSEIEDAVERLVKWNKRQK